VDKAYCPESFIEFTHRENIRFYVAADLSAWDFVFMWTVDRIYCYTKKLTNHKQCGQSSTYLEGVEVWTRSVHCLP
jgi:hypothetical protein